MDTNILLENETIKLRALEPEDLEILYRWENDTDLWKFASAVSPYSKLALRQYISDSLEMDIFQSKQLRLMIDLKETNQTIGTIDMYELDMRNRKAGIGILLDKSFRQKGYALSALQLMHDYAFNFIHLEQLYAYIGVNNLNSQKLFEKARYIQAGLLRNWVLAQNGKYEDVLIVQLIKD